MFVKKKKSEIHQKKFIMNFIIFKKKSWHP